MRLVGVMFLCRGGRREAGRLTPSGSESILRRDPWAAGTQAVPLPTAIQGLPLRGLRTGSGPISAPSVSSQRCGACSALGRGCWLFLGAAARRSALSLRTSVPLHPWES